MNYTIKSPLMVILPRKTKKDKRYSLNLNTFRNTHYLVNNQAKHIYHELMEEQLKGLVFKTPIRLTFTLYKKTARRIDRANVLSIVDKFFCDSLVEYGCIFDDNDEFIESSHYYSNGIDRDYPRVEIFIEEV